VGKFVSDEFVDATHASPAIRANLTAEVVSASSGAKFNRVLRLARPLWVADVVSAGVARWLVTTAIERGSLPSLTL